MFDLILLSTSTPEIIANSYLNILSAHPEFIEKYSLSEKVRIRFFIRSKLVTIVRVFKSIFQRKVIYIKNSSDILFVSHLTNSRQQLQEDDAYFGNLPGSLLKNNISSSIALINHTKDNIQISDTWKESKTSRFVLRPNLDFFSELRLYLLQKKSKKELRKILQDLDVDKTLAKNILNHHFSSDTFNAIRIAIQVTNIVKKTDARFVITTYEGHAWERLVYYYVKRISPSVKCIGYQHATLSKYQHAIKRPLRDAFNPDIIFTSGVITQEVFRKNKQIKSKIICLGSFKYVSLSVRTSGVKCCLVVPEGIIRECLTLFNLSLAYALQHQDQKFIWRLHPILNFDDLKKNNPFFRNLPNNIYISERSLDEDIQKCDCALYRGSTAVVNTINAGLKPIYYQQSTDELSIDPIYQQRQGKEIVQSQKELGLALNKDIDIKDRQALQDFAQNFYTPLDVQALKAAML